MERVLFKILLLKIKNNFCLVIKELKIELDRRWELLTVHFPNELSPQAVELDLEFIGGISNELKGFYR